MKHQKKVYSAKIYKLNEPYDEDYPEFDCVRPNEDGEYDIFDAWICDKLGNICPGYNISPVPINRKNLGRAVNTTNSE